MYCHLISSCEGGGPEKGSRIQCSLPGAHKVTGCVNEYTMPLTRDQLSSHQAQAMCQLPKQQQIGLVQNKALGSTESQPRILTPWLW